VSWFFREAESGFPEAGLLYSVSKEIAAMKEQLTAVFQQVPEGYIAFVEELPGANTQGGTIEEARANLQEAVQLVLEANRVLAEEALGDKVVIRRATCSAFMKRIDLIRHLERHGVQLLLEGGNHSVYVNRTASKTSTVPRH
jgi:predicted RNase H-like HicB family nuclease